MKKIDWRPISECPKDGTAFYVWYPVWNGRGPLVRTAWRGYWENEFGNGNAPDNFKPEWWTEIPEGPVI